MSFATERSIGSTQCSAPVLLTEVPAAGRGATRVGGLGGGAAGVMLAFASALGGGGGLGLEGCEVQEECSREQLEELMQQLLTTGDSDSSGDGGGEERCERRRAAAVTLALHAERDDELRAAMVGAGLLPEVAAMLEVRFASGVLT